MTGVHVYSRHRTLESLGDVFIKSILVVSVVTRLNEENVNCGSCSFKKKYECQGLNSTPFMTLTSLIFGLPHATTSWENIGKIFGESMACALLDFFFRFLFPLAYPSRRLRSIQDTEQNVQTIMTNCCRQNCIFFFRRGNRITNWRAWRNQNGSAKIVFEILCNKSSKIFGADEPNFFCANFHKNPQIQQIEGNCLKQLCVLQCETVAWKISPGASWTSVQHRLYFFVHTAHGALQSWQSTITQPLIARRIRRIPALYNIIWFARQVAHQQPAQVLVCGLCSTSTMEPITSTG